MEPPPLPASDAAGDVPADSFEAELLALPARLTRTHHREVGAAFAPAGDHGGPPAACHHGGLKTGHQPHNLRLLQVWRLQGCAGTLASAMGRHCWQNHARNSGAASGMQTSRPERESNG